MFLLTFGELVKNFEKGKSLNSIKLMIASLILLVKCEFRISFLVFEICDL